MPLTTGQMLQTRYRVVTLLGQGGMGAVYRAWDTRLNIPVAVKELVPQPGLDAATLAHLRQQFVQEAQVLARLDHPHLVNVSDYFEEGGKSYLVMKYVEGESLAARIEREGALDEARVLTWGQQLLEALVYCHGQGILHRDLKPQNVVVTPQGQAVLVDFGLVKLWDPGDPRTRTAIRGAGTPQYSPPEQYDAVTGHTDGRSDLYSLGATLYHALTGQSPPTATQRIVNPGSLQPIRQLRPDVSRATEELLMKALELQPARRFRSAGEMATALTRRRSSATPPPVPRVLDQTVKPSPSPVGVRQRMARRAKATPAKSRGGRSTGASAQGTMVSRPTVVRERAWGGSTSFFSLSTIVQFFLWVMVNAISMIVAFLLISSIYPVMEVSLFGFALQAVIVGLAFGIIQWVFLRRRVPNSFWWWLSGSVAGQVASWLIGWEAFDPATSFACGGIGGAVAGVGQWLLLRRHVRRAGWWVAASTLGWASMWGMASLIFDLVYSEFSDFPLFNQLNNVLSSLPYSLVTGPVLVWLLRNRKGG